MKRETLSYALHVLDNQRANVAAFNTATQAAYYDGMRAMFEIIASEAYTRDIYVAIKDDSHDILGAEWEGVADE